MTPEDYLDLITGIKVLALLVHAKDIAKNNDAT